MKIRISTLAAFLGCLSLSPFPGQTPQPSAPGNQPDTGLAFLHTGFENASPLYWEIDADGAIQVYLVYDQERLSPNRANGHWHFQIQAKSGAKLKVVLNNLENVWNGRKASPVSARTISFLSANGRQWRATPAKLLAGNRLQLDIEMPGPEL